MWIFTHINPVEKLSVPDRETVWYDDDVRHILVREGRLTSHPRVTCSRTVREQPGTWRVR